MQVEASVRHNMSKKHLSAAALFARICWDIEQRESEEEQTQYQYYAIGSIISAYSSIEAAINEFFQDAIDDKREMVEKISEESLTQLKSHWKTINNDSTLSKYQRALFCVRKQPFDEGSEPYQSVDNLRFFRNGLIHFSPEWDTEQKRHEKIEKRLQPYGFPLNPFIAEGNAFFPTKCLSHGYAEWAINSAVEFVNSFRNLVGLQPLFSKSDPFSTR